MFRGLMLAGGLAALSFGATACGGDVCEDAAEICGTDNTEGEGDAECTGAAEDFAQCIVDADDCGADTLAMCVGTSTTT